MLPYQCDPKAEVIGENVIAFLEHTLSDQFPLLDEHNLTTIDADQWYPLQKWLNVLSDLSLQPNHTSKFVSIGLGISRTAIIPDELQNASLTAFLDSADTIYQMQHRGADIGGIQVDHLAKNHISLSYDVVYPDYLEYGVYYGFARRLLPKGTPYQVYFDTTIRPRDLGGQLSVLHIKWQ